MILQHPKLVDPVRRLQDLSAKGHWRTGRGPRRPVIGPVVEALAVARTQHASLAQGESLPRRHCRRRQVRHRGTPVGQIGRWPASRSRPWLAHRPDRRTGHNYPRHRIDDYSRKQQMRAGAQVGMRLGSTRCAGGAMPAAQPNAGEGPPPGRPGCSVGLGDDRQASPDLAMAWLDPVEVSHRPHLQASRDWRHGPSHNKSLLAEHLSAYARCRRRRCRGRPMAADGSLPSRREQP
jgi:hypothetical protein